MNNGITLMVPDGIALERLNIPLHVHPEGEDKIDDQGRAHGEKRDIHKPVPDATGGNSQVLADGGAHPKKMPLDDMPELIHFTKLKYSGISGKCLLPQLVFLNYLCGNLKTGALPFHPGIPQTL
jgi:hypothetical protein